MSRRVDIGDNFEIYRKKVESVSVLFKLFNIADCKIKGLLARWVVTGARFEVEWPKDPSTVLSHFGASRFAYNFALAQVISDMDAKLNDPNHKSVSGNLAALRKSWNCDKAKVA